MKKTIAIFFAAIILAGAVGVQAEAASLFMLPKASSFNIGETFAVELKINAADEFLNATQATVSFPPDILELVSADKSGSAFNFWVQEPVISNEDGTLSFIGGTTRGISGGSLQVIRMKFKTKGAGAATLSVSDAVITANDGKGTNILGTVENASVRVGTQIVKSEAPSEESVPAILPKKVTRQPVAATKVSGKPVVTVPLYPDSATWYSKQGETIALWEVPDDVTAVAVAFDHKPETIPTEPEPELSTGKRFGILAEGTWYVHVRYKNNIGWGESARYKINIDTTAPLPFDISIDSEAGDNPIPKVGFSTADSLSGIDGYQIFVDKERVAEVTATTTSLTLPPQYPGKHTLRVRATDEAGNSTESTLPFEILPLEKPMVNFYTETISASETFFLSGTSLPGSAIIFKIENAKGNEIHKSVINADKNGKWEFRTADPFSSGNYSFNLTTVDERGARSFPTEDNVFRVRALVLFSIGSIDIGWFEILLLVILVMLGITIYLTMRELKKRAVREAYGTVVARDVLKFGVMLEEELGEIKNKGLSESPDKTEVSFRLDKMLEIVGRMKKYLGREVGSLKK